MEGAWERIHGSRADTLARLRRDRPDIHRRVLAGEITAHAGIKVPQCWGAFSWSGLGAARGRFRVGGRPGVFWSRCWPAFQMPKDREAVSANLDLVLTDRHRCGPAHAAQPVARQRRCRRHRQVGPFRCLAMW